MTQNDRVQMLLIIWAVGFPISLFLSIMYVRIFNITKVWSEEAYHDICGIDIVFPCFFWPIIFPIGAIIGLWFLLFKLVEWSITKTKVEEVAA